jgi:CheY-like chemotaxis protein
MFSIKCPKCHRRLEIHTQSQAQGDTRVRSLKTVVNDVESRAYDASEKPFDYVHAGVQTALLCENDSEVRQKIHDVVEGMNYHVVEAPSARNALKYMRFHNYNLVVVNETFDAAGPDSNHVLQYLIHLPMSIRGNTFVVLLSNSLKTMDNMTAFNKSVNLVVNLQNTDDMESILKGASTEHEEFYQVFSESLKKTGRA